MGNGHTGQFTLLQAKIFSFLPIASSWETLKHETGMENENICRTSRAAHKPEAYTHLKKGSVQLSWEVMEHSKHLTRTPQRLNVSSISMF